MHTAAFAGRKVLVTGAAGFIGSRLCTRLLQSGAEVYAVARTERHDLPQDLNWRFCDLADYDACHALVTSVRPDIIFHLASHVFGARTLPMVIPTFRSNLATTVNLLTVATEVQCGRILLTGSLEEPDWGSTVDAPSSPYAAAKWASSAYARMFRALFETPIVLLRVFMVYGPGQRDLKKLIPYTILTLLRGERPQMTSGTRLVDWIYVDDVVDAYLAAAIAGNVEGKTIEVGSGRLVSVREVAETLVRMLNPDLQIAVGAVPERPMEQVRVADVDTASRLLGWRPKIDLEQGLQSTIDWYAERLRSGRLPGQESSLSPREQAERNFLRENSD